VGLAEGATDGEAAADATDDAGADGATDAGGVVGPAAMPVDAGAIDGWTDPMATDSPGDD